MKRFSDYLKEVEEPKAGIEKKFKEVNTKDGEAMKNDVATDAQFKGTTSKKTRKADKDTGDGKVLPEAVDTKKREEIVKSMKDKKADFKKRYGDRASSVMYATATKLAKEAVEPEEAVSSEVLNVVEAGIIELEGGATVEMSEENADLLNDLYSIMDEGNKVKFVDMIFESEESLNKVIEFAKEV